MSSAEQAVIVLMLNTPTVMFPYQHHHKMFWKLCLQVSVLGLIGRILDYDGSQIYWTCIYLS